MAMTANGLTKLLEELGELAQVAAKKQAYFHTDAHPDGGKRRATTLLTRSTPAQMSTT